MVDRLTKQRLYKLLEDFSTGKFIEAMHHCVFSAHGYSLSIVNNCGGQMTNKLWRRLSERYGIRTRFSSTQHSEINGQTKNANKVMKNYLRAYVSYTQDDWVDHLPMAEFLANNHINESTRITPFFADNGFHFRTGIEPPRTYNSSVDRKTELLDADRVVATQKKMLSFQQDQLI